MIVVDILVKSFPDILDVPIHRGNGKPPGRDREGKCFLAGDNPTVLYPLSKAFKGSGDRYGISPAESREPAEGVSCPLCNSAMLIRWGKRGRFLSCEKYPDCKGILPYETLTGTVKRTGAKTLVLPANCSECGAPPGLEKRQIRPFRVLLQIPTLQSKRTKAGRTTLHPGRL